MGGREGKEEEGCAAVHMYMYVRCVNNSKNTHMHNLCSQTLSCEWTLTHSHPLDFWTSVLPSVYIIYGSTIQLCAISGHHGDSASKYGMLTLSPYSPLVADLGLVRHTSQPGWGTGPRDLFSAIPSGASELAV